MENEKYTYDLILKTDKINYKLTKEDVEVVKDALCWFYYDLGKIVSGESKAMYNAKNVLTKLGVELNDFR